MSQLAAFTKFARAGYVLMREGVISSLPREGAPAPVRIAQKIGDVISRRRNKDAERSEKLSQALHRLGPTWVKLGQLMATRPDIVGTEIALDLESLQDQVEPFPKSDALASIEETLQKPIDFFFANVSDPIAAASIAQVHSADLVGLTDLENTDLENTGLEKTKAAIKVIRPGVREQFNADLDAYYTLARKAERWSSASARLKPVAIVDVLAQSARQEMDLRFEAAALSEMAENTKDDAGFRVPKVDWQRSSRDCLTMEWINGIKMSNVAALDEAGFDRKALAENLMQSFLRHALRDGFFHADMHPGNLFVDTQGDIVAVDFGIVGRLGQKERRFLAEILYGFITRDYMRVAEVHFEAGYVPHHHDKAAFAQAIRAIGEPIHGQSAESISMAKLLTLLFEVTEIFDMETRPELLLLQKTMVVVEGVARGLDGEFNMWKVSEPVIKDWISRHLGPIGIAGDAKEGLKAAHRLARQLPEFAERTERLSQALDDMAANGMRFDKETAETIGKAEARHTRSGRIALWVIALSALFIASKFI